MDSKDKHDQDERAEVRARRRLLKIFVYTPPAVIGTLLVSKKGLAQDASCPPATGCQPTCGPSTCGPSTCKPGSG